MQFNHQQVTVSLHVLSLSDTANEEYKSELLLTLIQSVEFSLFPEKSSTSKLVFFHCLKVTKLLFSRVLSNSELFPDDTKRFEQITRVSVIHVSEPAGEVQTEQRALSRRFGAGQSVHSPGLRAAADGDVRGAVPPDGRQVVLQNTSGCGRETSEVEVEQKYCRSTLLHVLQ